MIWNKIIIRTTTNDADIISAILCDYAITDIQIEDNIQLTDEELNQIYADFKKELPPDDGTCSINFYLDENGCIPGESVGTGDSPTVLEGMKVDMDALKKDLEEAPDIYGIGPVEIEESRTEVSDWENSWKEYFKPFDVDGILIKPTWEEIPEDFKGDAVVNIDPGMAFGTGMHETTRLCLKGVKKYIHKNDRVLDLGCGSGILGIAALKLGASTVTGVDIDEQAVKVAYENFELNTGEDENEEQKVVFQLNVGNVLEDSALNKRLAENRYNLVTANILAEIIEPLVAKIHEFMLPGAYFIASGILKEKLELITKAVENNAALEFVETETDGDWASVVAKRK